MSKNNNMAEKYQKWGEDYYVLATNLENSEEPQSSEKIEASFHMAALQFWNSLVLGGNKAPISLFKCFVQGVGVKKDEDIAALMYGVAEKLTPKECAKIPESSKVVIPKSMKPIINKLVELIKDTQAQLSREGVDESVLFNQLTKFDDTIKLPSGRKMESYFTESSPSQDDDQHPISTPSTSAANADSFDYIGVDISKTAPASSANYENIQVKTPRLVFQVARDLFNESKQPGNRVKANDFLNKSKPLFEEAFALGTKEAAIYLAYISFSNHRLDLKDNLRYETAKLYIAAGKLLGDPLCMAIIKGIDNPQWDMKGFLAAIPYEKSYTKDIWYKANKIAKVVEQNYQKYLPESYLTKLMVAQAIESIKKADPENIMGFSKDDYTEPTSNSSSGYVTNEYSITSVETANFTPRENPPDEISLTGDTTTTGCFKCVIL